MVYVCLALVAVLAITVVSFTSLLRSEKRAYARREDALIDKMLHSVGRPWTPAPADEVKQVDESRWPSWPSWTATPEQLPVYDTYQDDEADRREETFA